MSRMDSGTGLQVLGVVIGGLPMIINTVYASKPYYPELSKTLDDLIETLKAQHLLMRNDLQNILAAQSSSLGPDRIAEILAQPHAIYFRHGEVISAVERALGDGRDVHRHGPATEGPRLRNSPRTRRVHRGLPHARCGEGVLRARGEGHPRRKEPAAAGPVQRESQRRPLCACNARRGRIPQSGNEHLRRGGREPHLERTASGSGAHVAVPVPDARAWTCAMSDIRPDDPAQHHPEHGAGVLEHAAETPAVVFTGVFHPPAFPDAVASEFAPPNLGDDLVYEGERSKLY
ncbi:uncharacterized protein DSM5745_05815 [Aspergillus mulundensis]|uniref:Uncharacterized protein n=1 Tax=Aspergillus mulundensis TaxID=1810919 RepID=A0A3D8RY25_9EURO|nr:hypothetical protein DSM5745_05815 [Aspergillus mulundensis]RDW78963.1 hypothetical protein DSM5745_05815 [Aspergillus mulundensis]